MSNFRLSLPVQLTVADLSVYNFIDCLIDPNYQAFVNMKSGTVERRFDIFDAYKLLKNNFREVGSVKGVANYLRKRPERDM